MSADGPPQKPLMGEVVEPSRLPVTLASGEEERQISRSGFGQETPLDSRC
jgi:hypothetical protein